MGVAVATTETPTGPRPRRHRRGWGSPLAVGGAVVLGGAGALAWVAPRIPVPAATPPAAARQQRVAAELRAEAEALNRLHQDLLAREQAIGRLAAARIPQLRGGAGPAGTAGSGPQVFPALPNFAPLTLPPAVHGTTGASHVP